MRCAQAEKLIPLYAGDDLPVEQTVELRGHLESCAQCRRLVAEFEESRDWLINFATPEFDEATLDGVRDTVLEEIGQVEKRPRLVEWILPSWNPRLAFVVATVLLLLIAASALFIYRQPKSPISKPSDVMAGQNDRKDKSESPQQIDRNGERQDKESVVVETKQSSRKSTRKPFKPDLSKSSQVEVQPIEPDPIAQSPTTPEPAPDQSVNAVSTQTDLAVNRNMLRIEIQTADPNIRIIWFAPKTDTSPTIIPNTK